MAFAKPLHAASIYLHLTTSSDREREELYDALLKVLDDKGIKYNPSVCYNFRGWRFLPQVELATIRDEASEE